MNLKIMCGLPRSGKSTFADNHCRHYNIVCADDIRMSMGFQYNHKSENLVWAMHDIMFRALLYRRKDIVIDSTNLSLKRIHSYCKSAKEWGDYNTEVVVFETSLEICLKLNCDGNDGFVPEHVIDKMNVDFENLKSDHEFIENDLIDKIRFVKWAFDYEPEILNLGEVK